jgi:hypothetical protein
MKTLEPKRFLSLALLAVALPAAACVAEDDGVIDDSKSDSPDRLLELPFYFSVPKTAVTVPLERAKYPFPTLWNPSVQGDEVGLRVIAVQQGTTVASKQAARRDMAAKLAAAGVLQDGDIALTFRPELAGTMAYPHIQMGVTHAGLVYTKNGQAFNIDSPLDSEYMGQFDAKHYAGNGADDGGTNALTIVRPRAMTPERRAQLREWITTLQAGLPRINGQRAQIKFQSDYLTPAYKSANATTRQTITKLGQIILEVDTTTKQPMYCSEFAWHMLALSNCTAEQIRNAPAEGADCVDEVFAAAPLTEPAAGQIGMADGPLRALLALPVESRGGLVESIFATGDAAKLSSGHRMVAEQVAPLMVPLSQLYSARAGGAPLEATAPIATQLNAAVANNYSPTTFLVQAVEEDRLRVVDYVVTIGFVDAKGMAKAKVLSKRPVP